MEDDSILSTEETTTFSRNNLLSLQESQTAISPLEQEVLDEYERLLTNMDQLRKSLQELSSGPTTVEIAETLRLLERKVASVYTLMKASVYSIVLQQGQADTTQLDQTQGLGEEYTQMTSR